MRLPILTQAQRTIKKSKAVRKVVATGRRVGKTTLASDLAVDGMLSGKVVIYGTPIVRQSRALWRTITKWCKPLEDAALVKVNKADKTIEMVSTGGRIECRTCNDPDSLRSDACDILILDEAAYLAAAVWLTVGQPMLMDQEGSVAYLFSTPNLRNYFYRLYLKAKVDQSGAWEAFKFTSHDNPHLSKTALDMLTEDMTDVDYKQEIMAEFVEGEGSVFSMHPDDFGPHEGSHKGHRIVAGLDWAKQNDFTVLCIGCATCMQELEMHRTNKIDYVSQRDMVKSKIGKYPDIELLAESNSMGQPNIDQMRHEGVAVIAFVTTHSSKAKLVQQMRLSLFQRTWKWLDDPIARDEMEAYEMKVSRAGNVIYSAPEGFNDDTVVARMLALHQSIQGTFTLA